MPVEGLSTPRESFAVWESVPDVPTKERDALCGEALALALRVTVCWPEAERLKEEGDAATPEGSPLTLTLICPENPFKGDAEICTVAVEPWPSTTLPGCRVKEKSAGGGGEPEDEPDDEEDPHPVSSTWLKVMSKIGTQRMNWSGDDITRWFSPLPIVRLDSRVCIAGRGGSIAKSGG
jgi:hypothetical protein